MCNGNITISQTQSTPFASLRQGIKLAPDPLQCPSSIPAFLLLLLLLAYLSNRSKCFIVTLPHTYTHTCTYKDIHICTCVHILIAACVYVCVCLAYKVASVSFCLCFRLNLNRLECLSMAGFGWREEGERGLGKGVARGRKQKAKERREQQRGSGGID